MICKPTDIPDVKLIELDVFEDERGFFAESFNVSKYAELGIPTSFVQDNRSHSKKGVLRGMHYQITHSQGKLIEVVTGEIFDAVVDLRKHSTTFGKWIGMTLSAETGAVLWIPAGFAHGFYVLSDYADIKYKVTDYYDAGAERTMIWNDSRVDCSGSMIRVRSQAHLLSPERQKIMHQRYCRCR